MFDNSETNDISVIAPAKKSSPIFPAVDGIELVHISKSDKGGNSVIFKFKDKTGAVLEHREFEPKKVGQMTDEDLIKSNKLTTSRIAHIVRAFLSETEMKAIKGSNWDEYIKNTVLALGIDANGVPSRAKGVICQLKVVLRENKGKYYSALPKVPAFISSPNHPKTFTFDPNYDLVEVPLIKPDAEKASTTDTSQGFNVNSPAPESAAQATAGSSVPKGW